MFFETDDFETNTPNRASDSVGPSRSIICVNRSNGCTGSLRSASDSKELSLQISKEVFLTVSTLHHALTSSRSSWFLAVDERVRVFVDDDFNDAVVLDRTLQNLELVSPADAGSWIKVPGI